MGECTRITEFRILRRTRKIVIVVIRILRYLNRYVLCQKGDCQIWSNRVRGVVLSLSKTLITINDKFRHWTPYLFLFVNEHERQWVYTCTFFMIRENLISNGVCRTLTSLWTFIFRVFPFQESHRMIFSFWLNWFYWKKGKGISR